MSALVGNKDLAVVWAQNNVSGDTLKKVNGESATFGGRLYTLLTGREYQTQSAKEDIGKANLIQLLFQYNKYDLSTSCIVDGGKLRKVSFIQIFMEKVRRLFGFEDRTVHVASKIHALSNLLSVTPEQQALVQQAITTFANHLCQRISASQPEKSFSLSPVSIIAVLGMCLHAVPEENKGQFLVAMGLGGISEAEAHKAIAAVLQGLQLPKDFANGSIETAQGLACKPNISLADSFKHLMRDTYDAEVLASEDLMGTVNKWAAEKTHDKIPKILEDNSPEVAVLNAIYLALQWKNKFKKPTEGWETAEFTCADGTAAPVSMMVQQKSYSLCQKKAFEMLEMPYLSPEGRKLSQVIFLPKDPTKLNILEKNLSAEFISLCRKDAKVEEVIVRMPKTKAEWGSDILKILKEMGLPLDLVDPKILSKANFSKVIHKTFVSNDEKGTKAAAVTAGLIEKCMPPDPKTFDMKHSYVYLIMDGDTLLFRGRISDKEPLVVDRGEKK